MNEVWIVFASCCQDNPEFVYAVYESEVKAKELVSYILHQESDLWNPRYEKYEIQK